jgi:hypothetical protein
MIAVLADRIAKLTICWRSRCSPLTQTRAFKRVSEAVVVAAGCQAAKKDRRCGPGNMRHDSRPQPADFVRALSALVRQGP